MLWLVILLIFNQLDCDSGYINKTICFNKKYQLKIQGRKTRLIPIVTFQYVIKGKANDLLLDDIKMHFLSQEYTS